MTSYWKIIVILLCLGSTAGVAEQQKLTVFAAASLVDGLTQAIEPWAKKQGVEVIYNYDASSRLARQIESGAGAHLFVSANRDWLQYLLQKHKVTGERVLIANRLVMVSRNQDLEVPAGIRKLGIAGENVPAGKYAFEALVARNWWAGLQPKLVRGHHVRSALQWAISGNVDAAIVYATDAKAAGDQIHVIHRFAETTHSPIRYHAASVLPDTPLARSLLEYLRGERAQAVFAAQGFERAVTP